MKANYGKVVSVIEDNPVIEGSTIVNTVYDCDSYRISYISMSKGTYMFLERFRSPVMLVVYKGTLHLSLKNKKNEVSDVYIKAGQEYYRPANEYAGYYADDENVIFAEITLRRDSEVAMRVIPHRIQDIIHLVHYEPGQVSCAHLINDEFFQFNMMAFSESEKIEFHCKKQPVSINCVAGKVTIQHDDEHYVLFPGKCFHIPLNYDCTVFVASRSKLIVLYLSDKERHII